MNLLIVDFGKMITMFQIDKSGGDIFEKDYSISLILIKKRFMEQIFPRA